MAPLRIAIVYENCQLSDITCADLLGNCSTENIRMAAEVGFGYLLPHARDMEFLYVASALGQPAMMTPSLRCMPTHTYNNAPRDVDIMLVGGPPFTSRPEGSLQYMQEVCKDKKPKVIMTTCVGALWLADAGCLKGVKATTNRGALFAARELHSDVEWIDQRWVIDGKDHLKFWTSGGAGAGIDMLATFVRANFHEAIANAACDALDFDPTARGQFYSGPLTDWRNKGKDYENVYALRS